MHIIPARCTTIIVVQDLVSFAVKGDPHKLGVENISTFILAAKLVLIVGEESYMQFGRPYCFVVAVSPTCCHASKTSWREGRLFIG